MGTARILRGLELSEGGRDPLGGGAHGLGLAFDGFLDLLPEPFRALAHVAPQSLEELRRHPQGALDGLRGQAQPRRAADNRHFGASLVVAIGVGRRVGRQKVELEEGRHGTSSPAGIAAASRELGGSVP